MTVVGPGALAYPWLPGLPLTNSRVTWNSVVLEAQSRLVPILMLVLSLTGLRWRTRM